MIGYCPNCDQDRRLKRVLRNETFEIRGEPVQVRSTVLICSHCSITVSDPDLDERTLLKAYNEYRRRHGLLFPEQIRAFRKAYGLSQRALSRLLGWGDVTIQRYEKGALQDKAHDVVLRQLGDPRFVLGMLERHADHFSARERGKIERNATQIAGAQSVGRLLREAQEWVEYASRPEDRGGRRHFDVSHFGDVVLWFAHQDKNLFKTKLAKLLWLADFGHYARYGCSITGLTYVRVPNGPMPNDFAMLLGLLDSTEVIRLEPVEVGKYSGDLVVPARDLPRGTLDERELDTLERVVARFGHLRASDLSGLSHQEPLWTYRQNGEVIPYHEAHQVGLVQRLWQP